MGAITQAMQKACNDVGVKIFTDASVDRVIVEDGAAVGIQLDSGNLIKAKKIVSNLNPKLLYKKLISKNDLDPEFNRSMDGYKCCLLYTSPSPRDQRGSRMPSSA